MVTREMTATAKPQDQEVLPLGLVCEEDEREKEFDRLVKLWVDDQISYKVLLRNYPEYELSMIRRVLNLVSEKLSHS